jgi:hypothetical protein
MLSRLRESIGVALGRPHTFLVYERGVGVGRLSGE